MISRALVVGYGSIGARHARILGDLGLQVAVVSRRGAAPDNQPAFPDIRSALHSFRPDYVVVANETARHGETLTDLSSAGFSGPILVEKPILSDINEAALPSAGQISVAYNLRFHPALRALASRISEDRAICAQIYVGQYLPNWRPGVDYRQSYSARSALGGGVLRDLSHELDYLQWIFGPWSRLAAMGGKRSALEIDSDDAWCVLIETRQGAMITLQLNYLDRVARREITVVGANRSYRADLVAGTLGVDSSVESFSVERDTTYIEQHKAAIAGRWDELCSRDEGIAVLSTIAAIERSAAIEAWVRQ